MKINEKNLCVFATTPPYDLEGYLNKRGDLNKAWQKRYFVLKGNLLFYSEKKGDKEPLGLIILEGCIIELAEESENYSFQIVFNGNRTYILGADSQEVMEMWMKSLTCAGYEYKKLLLAELQRQLEEIEGSQKKHVEEAIQSVAPKPPPRRLNPFNRPAPPPPILPSTLLEDNITKSSAHQQQQPTPAGTETATNEINVNHLNHSGRWTINTGPELLATNNPESISTILHDIHDAFRTVIFDDIFQYRNRKTNSETPLIEF